MVNDKVFNISTHTDWYSIKLDTMGFSKYGTLGLEPLKEYSAVNKVLLLSAFLFLVSGVWGPKKHVTHLRTLLSGDARPSSGGCC